MKLNAIQIFFIIILFLGCKKHDNPNPVVTPIVPQLEADKVGISGLVLNGDGSAASNVSVIIDGKPTVTNTGGVFEYTGTVTNTDKVIVKISKQGHFSYSKTLVVDKDAMLGGLKFFLEPELVAGTFSSVSGGTITTNYATLVFPANGFLKENGSAYQGTVSVKMPLLPLQVNRQYPGDGRGVTSTAEKVVIDPWAGFNIDLYGQAGEKLKLSKPMNYSFDMGSNYVYAPATMKQWAYNEAEGNWYQNGLANLNGKFLVGTTLSLSYLAWGISYPPSLLRAFVRDKNMNVASNFVFHNFTAQYGGGEQSSPINSKGISLMYIPAGRSGRTAIFSPCDDRIALLGVAPIPAATTANQTFEVDLKPYLTSVTGKVEDCNFAPLKGKAEFIIDNKKYTSEIKNGVYDFSFISCSSGSGTLIVYDEQNNQIYKNTSITPLRGNKNLRPAISPCTFAQKGSVTIILDGVTHTFQAPRDLVEFKTVFVNGAMTTLVNASSEVTKESFYLTYVGESAGKFSIYTFGFNLPGKNYLMTWGIYPAGSVTVNKFKTGNTLIEGSFSSKTTLNPSPSLSDKVVESTGTFSISH